jgi:hypothetical protein
MIIDEPHVIGGRYFGSLEIVVNSAKPKSAMTASTNIGVEALSIRCGPIGLADWP